MVLCRLKGHMDQVNKAEISKGSQAQVGEPLMNSCNTERTSCLGNQPAQGVLASWATWQIHYSHWWIPCILGSLPKKLNLGFGVGVL